VVAERQFTTGAAAEQLLAKCYTRTNRANVRLVRGFPGREFQKGRKSGRGLTRTARGGLGTQWKLRKGGNHRVSGRWFIGSPEGSSGSHHRRGFVRSPDSLSSHRSQHGLSDTSAHTLVSSTRAEGPRFTDSHTQRVRRGLCTLLITAWVAFSDKHSGAAHTASVAAHTASVRPWGMAYFSWVFYAITLPLRHTRAA
jgi:hypothetical protein